MGAFSVHINQDLETGLIERGQSGPETVAYTLEMGTKPAVMRLSQAETISATGP
jgi:hypothetical protein